MRICIFGDSITWGASDSEKGGWAERLKIYMADHHDATIYNLGVCGDKTDDVLDRIEVESKAREPNVIVFAIGINDSEYVFSKKIRRVPLEMFQRNIGKLHEVAMQFVNTVAFIGLTNVDESRTRPTPWSPDREYDNAGIAEYDKAIRDYCSDKSLPFIQMRDVLDHGDLEDGIHPNSRGHEKIFEKIKPEMEKLKF